MNFFIFLPQKYIETFGHIGEIELRYNSRNLKGNLRGKPYLT